MALISSQRMPPRSGCITAAGLPAIIIDICSNKEDRLYLETGLQRRTVANLESKLEN